MNVVHYLSERRCRTRREVRPALPKWAGATPRTFWAAEGRKSGVAPARFSVFSAVTFSFLALSISYSPKQLLAPQGEHEGEGEGGVCTPYSLHSFPVGSCSRGSKPAEHFSGEMYDGLSIACAELLADVVLSYSAKLPSAIEMFEALPSESDLGLITINQVNFGDGRVPADACRLRTSHTSFATGSITRRASIRSFPER